MNAALSRRQFVTKTLTAGTALAMTARLSPLYAQSSPGNRVVVAVAGIHARGLELIGKFTRVPGVAVKYVIDVDRRYLPKAVAAVQKQQPSAPKTETDFRRVLEDKAVDALIIATPDHWHAPMATLAVKAGKHVYVEKPCSHNPREGEILVEVAQKHRRLVQMGSQRRSIRNVQQMVQQLRAGVIGQVYLAQCSYARRRAPIGFGKEIAPPAELDWDLWQGPAPRTAYRDNIHPYNWHWFWRWGTGEALNNGVHLLDVARWGLDVTYPTKVNSFGGRWHDVGLGDGEAPDTQQIQLEYGPQRGITWFGRSTNTFGPGFKSEGIVFFGSQGILDYNGGGGFTVYDLDNKPVSSAGAGDAQKVNLTNSVDPGLDETHAQNFIEAIRSNAKLNAPIAEGHCSTLLAQLGNIAQRTGRSLQIDPADGHILGDHQAAELWTRDYAPGWQPTV
jgi:predicted dehydrogenase